MSRASTARVLGDEYQARFFWTQAARLFHPNSNVASVAFEYDELRALDDVVTYYKEPEADGRGGRVDADYYQLKFHVTLQGAIRGTSLIAPEFIGASNVSFLERLRDAAARLGDRRARFHLVTPWQVHPDDELAGLVSPREGELRMADLFDAGPRSNLGTLRQLWRNRVHLNDEELMPLIAALRINGGIPLDMLQRELDNSLALSGLRPVPRQHEVHPYDDLVWKLLEAGRNRFNAEEMLEVCVQNDLYLGPPMMDDKGATRLGIRSFLRYAEHMEDTVDVFLPLDHLFNGRALKPESGWNGDIVQRMQSFFDQHVHRGGHYRLHLDTHTSIAFGAGHLVAKCPAAFDVVQVTNGLAMVWTQASAGQTVRRGRWQIEAITVGQGNEVGVAVGVTHDVRSDVAAYTERNLGEVGTLLVCRLAAGVGGTAIGNSEDADLLAAELAQLIADALIPVGQRGPLHWFVAGPNGFTFFLGRHTASFPECVTYEYDFDNRRLGAYAPSITFSREGSSQ
ncbi:MAG: SAVED domain-containing protein [Chloroflexota bacterium]